jgi:hypothetical protein
MEQRLDATFLTRGPIERAAAAAFVCIGVGLAILFAAWGVSLLWRHTTPEIAVRVANPELRLAPTGPLVVTQDKPFIIAEPGPLKIEPPELIIKTEQAQRPSVRSGDEDRTGAGEIIKREVTVFSSVRHGPGTVVTGWTYPDGKGGTPVKQFCYYTVPDSNNTSTKVDIAIDRTRHTEVNAYLVPDLEGALAKCQWWGA